MISRSQVTAEGDWASIGVDDLMKYRIVEFLYRPGCERADIGSSDLADALGFRSIEVFVDELGELAEHGVVSAGARAGLWRIASDERLIAKVRGLLAVEESDPARKGEVISALARKSLARTRAKARGGGRRSGSSSAGGGAFGLLPLRPAS